ncbi:MAG: outer membrane protein assembly factor BamA [Bacteroidota bacterium]|nr:outer membrane protein assembly factor BamA [Bacteroidota bacterium]MDP4225939.1 outer membrane protein assembly factor BamA [Bacteroidota bacterium]MDP4273541.1 outer membrane protein assembly factor BamA [Bacteroidota bacterium]
MSKIKKAALFIICIFSIPYNIFSQTAFSLPDSIMDYSSPKEYEIADITISGVKFLDNNILINLSGLRKGQKISVPGDAITKTIQKYWNQGLFSDVKIRATKIVGNKIYLDIYLKERPRLGRLEVTGIKKSDKDDLIDKLKLKTGTQVTDNLLNNTVLAIKRHFTEKGFFNVKTTITQQMDTLSQNRVDLNIHVDKNSKVKIQEIVFFGNQAFSTKKLRHKMKKTKQKTWNFFVGSKLVEKLYKEDKEKLIKFYNENGYRDARILNDSIAVVSGNRIKLFIWLEEGRKYYFRKITWVGNTKYPAEVLNQVLGIKKGDVFDQSLLDKRLQQDEDAVSSLYLDNGYLFFTVTPFESKIDNDSIDLEMRIHEGKPATINKIIISGNTKTNEHVVRRELRTKPGQLFSKSDIMRSVRELATLGHFDPEKIEPVPVPNPSDGTVDLEYKLVEKANDQLEISGGWGANMFVGTVGIRFSNFSAREMFNPKAWRPIPSGDGQSLSVRAQTNGSYYQSYSLSFSEPWFGGKKPNSFSFSMFYSKQSGYYSYYQKSAGRYLIVSGASVGLGKRLTVPDDYFTLSNEVDFQQYHLKDWTDSYKNPIFLFANGRSNSLTFKTTFGRNSVDQPIYPRRGSQFSITLELTPPISLFKRDNWWILPDNQKAGLSETEIANEEEKEHYKWIEYHKWTYKGTYYLNIFDKLVVSANSQFGYLGRYNRKWGYSPFEKFELGGDGMTGYTLYGVETIGLRGYTNGSLTPQLNGRNEGNIYDKFTFELRYPFSLSPTATIYGLTFLEGGNAWTGFGQFNPFIIKRSAGVGIRAFLPMFGMLGIDWGYGFDNAYTAGSNHGQFHFTMGQQF